MANSFTMNQSDTKYLDVALRDEDNQTALDITGCSLTFTLKDLNNVTKVTKTTGNGITVTNAKYGECQVLLLDSDTNGLLGKYNYSIKLTDAYGNKSTVVKDTITIED